MTAARRLDRTGRPRLLTARFGLVVASGLCYFTGLSMLQPVLPRYIEGPLGAGGVGVGIGVGVLFVGAVVLRPYAGRLGDRLGRRVLIIGGAAVVAVTTLGYGLVESLPWIVGVRALTGIGEAAFFVGAATMITDLAPPERRGEAVSYWSVAIYGGIAIGPVLGERVVGDGRYAAAWVVSATLAAVAAALGLGTREVERDVPAATGLPLLHRAALAPGVVLALGLVALAGFVTFLPLYVRDIGVRDAGPFFLLYGALILVVRVLGARLPDRLGPMRSATASLTLVASGMVVMVAWRSVGGLVAGTIVFALGMALHYPALMLLAIAGVPDSERASVVGTFSAFFDLAQGLGALLAGVTVAASGANAGAFGLGAGAALAGLAFLRTSGAVRGRTAPAVPPDGRAARPL